MYNWLLHIFISLFKCIFLLRLHLFKCPIDWSYFLFFLKWSFYRFFYLLLWLLTFEIYYDIDYEMSLISLSHKHKYFIESWEANCIPIKNIFCTMLIKFWNILNIMGEKVVYIHFLLNSHFYKEFKKDSLSKFY